MTLNSHLIRKTKSRTGCKPIPGQIDEIGRPPLYEPPPQQVAHLRNSCASPSVFWACEWTPHRTPTRPDQLDGLDKAICLDDVRRCALRPLSIYRAHDPGSEVLMCTHVHRTCGNFATNTISRNSGIARRNREWSHEACQTGNGGS